MKKQKVTVALILSAMIGFAQPYGQTQYPNASIMTSGYRTSLIAMNDGFIMAGMKGTNIHIDKAKSGGAVPSTIGPYSFQRDYSLFENGGCLNSSGAVTSCVGVSAIELRQPNNGWYVMAGAYNNACFITYLAPDGNPNTTIAFPFPSTATMVTRPTVVENLITHELYVCGAYNAGMYALKINTSGTLLWSAFYNAGNGPFMQPRDMIISAHTGELIIVGHMSPDFNTYGSASDGFFLALNPGTGNINAFRNYNSTPCNWFNSVKDANCTAAGGPGYLIGGYTDAFANTGGALMMKLDYTGNILWNTLITGGSPGIYTSEIKGVVERQNTSGQYEYYGVAQTWDNNFAPAQYADMTVFKLNAAGLPAAGNNEYHYGAIASSQLMPVNLSFVPATASADAGLHVYANNSGNHYLLESYFNGFTGCNENMAMIAAIEPGPNMVNMPIVKYGNLTTCNKLSVTQVVAGATPNPICTNTFLGSGSNAKTMTGINGQQQQSNVLSVYPNPGNGLYTLEVSSNAEITICNILGEIVHKETVSSGKNTIDLRNEKNGIYMIKISDGFETKNLQVIKN